MEFAPIEPRESAVDACARTVRQAIVRGEIEPGSRLPAERALANSFGVNRVTVRGALAKLEAAGLVSVRQGSGYVVQDFQREGGPELLAGFASLAQERGQLPEVVRDLLFMRRHLARALLCRLATRDGLDPSPVAAAVDAFAEVVANRADLLAIGEADLEVIHALFEATGSGVLRLCANPVFRAVNTMPKLRELIYAEPEANVLAYRFMVAWLDDPKAEQIEGILTQLGALDDAAVTRLEQEGRAKRRTKPKQRKRTSPRAGR